MAAVQLEKANMLWPPRNLPSIWCLRVTIRACILGIRLDFTEWCLGSDYRKYPVHKGGGDHTHLSWDLRNNSCSAHSPGLSLSPTAKRTVLPPSASQTFWIPPEKSWVQNSARCPCYPRCSWLQTPGWTQWDSTLTSTPHGLGPNIDQSDVISLYSLRCLTPDAEARPDIVEVSSMISDVMMKYLDTLSTSQLALEKKLDRERKRTQRYFMEANRNAVTCHRELALLSHVSAHLSVSSWCPLTGMSEVVQALS